ncbi:MAG: hypothetical protein ONB46_08920 [candidate division KSB1 bacterium]|nr:hypothetical protein [candidate division KSB1 bacterium]MDZ7365854.1 hypothetical protein [candidate division KSB1 bacterium]MDZ7403911.1 hypothetical protein [candidate division KSB1 bacterium]
MQEEIITHEGILEKVRQRLGSLDDKAEQAVMETIAVLNESSSQAPDESFVSANVSVAQYTAWSPEERFQYLNNAEKVNAHWVEQRLQELNAAWLMVIDGQVVAHDEDFQNLPKKQEFKALCQKHGKYPFVFFNPRLFMIEETTTWHATKEPNDAYPTVAVKLGGDSNEARLKADFDTGATHAYIDLNFLLRSGLLTIEVDDYERESLHLNRRFRFFAKLLQFSVHDQNGKSKEAEVYTFCIKNWHKSPFVAINPNRTALIGRGLFHKLSPVVHLDFASRRTEIEFHDSNA